MALPLAGDAAHQLNEHGLADGEAATVFVATWLACARGDSATLSRLGALAAADPSFAGAVVAALTWRPMAQIEAIVRGLLASNVPTHRLMGVRVLLDRRVQSFGDLTRYLNDTFAPVRAMTATLAGVLKRTQDVDALRALRNDPDAGVQWAAARALMLLGDANASVELLACASGSQASAEVAASLLVRCLDHGTARSWIQSLTKNESMLRLGISASGMFGDTRVVDWLLVLMDDPQHARLAGEAFALMTGADLDPMALRRDPPENFDPDTDLLADEDADLGWPDTHKVKQWWMTHRSGMPPERRHLGGRLVSTGTATHVLRHGYQRQRAQAAIELALMSAPAMEFPVRAPGPWQRQRLAA